MERSKKIQAERNKGSPTEMICQLLRQKAASHEKMDVFSEDPIDYQYFQTIFREVAEKTIKDPIGMVIKLTDDKEKDMIKHYIYLSAESGCQTKIW